MKNSYKTLNNKEHNVLNKIADKTKMDCWFAIRQKKDGTDYIYDMENRKRMCLKNVISQLVEGIDCIENYKNCNISTEENLTFRKLLKKLKIKFVI